VRLQPHQTGVIMQMRAHPDFGDEPLDHAPDVNRLPDMT
jgi:hypothetical protein